MPRLERAATTGGHTVLGHLVSFLGTVCTETSPAPSKQVHAVNANVYAAGDGVHVQSLIYLEFNLEILDKI